MRLGLSRALPGVCRVCAAAPVPGSATRRSLTGLSSPTSEVGSCFALLCRSTACRLFCCVDLIPVLYESIAPLAREEVVVYCVGCVSFRRRTFPYG